MGPTADTTATTPPARPPFSWKNKDRRVVAGLIATESAAPEASEFKSRWDDIQRRGPPATSTPH